MWRCVEVDDEGKYEEGGKRFARGRSVLYMFQESCSVDRVADMGSLEVERAEGECFKRDRAKARG